MGPANMIAPSILHLFQGAGTAPPQGGAPNGAGEASFFEDLHRLLPNASTFELGDVGPLLLHLLAALAMGQLLAWHFVRYAQVLANKRRFGRLFPLIAGTTLLMISVVKVSLALSLGLVGALSIIRFRTPIKEPEELAYLFLAIAIGVGLGAEQLMPTLLVFLVLLLFLALRTGLGRRDQGLSSILQITAPLAAVPAGAGEARAGGGDDLQRLLEALRPCCRRLDLRRADLVDGEFHVSLMVDAASADQVTELLDAARQTFPGARVSLVDRDGLD